MNIDFKAYKERFSKEQIEEFVEVAKELQSGICNTVSCGDCPFSTVNNGLGANCVSIDASSPCTSRSAVDSLLVQSATQFIKEMTMEEKTNEEKYIYEDFEGEFPEWWTGRPIRCYVGDSEEELLRRKEQGSSLLVGAIIPNSKYSFITLDCTSRSIEYWANGFTAWKYAEPVLKSTKKKITLKDIQERFGEDIEIDLGDDYMIKRDE